MSDTATFLAELDARGVVISRKSDFTLHFKSSGRRLPDDVRAAILARKAEILRHLKVVERVTSDPVVQRFLGKFDAVIIDAQDLRDGDQRPGEDRTQPGAETINLFT